MDVLEETLNDELDALLADVQEEPGGLLWHMIELYGKVHMVVEVLRSVWFSAVVFLFASGKTVTEQVSMRS